MTVHGLDFYSHTEIVAAAEVAEDIGVVEQVAMEQTGEVEEGQATLPEN